MSLGGQSTILCVSAGTTLNPTLSGPPGGVGADPSTRLGGLVMITCSNIICWVDLWIQWIAEKIGGPILTVTNFRMAGEGLGLLSRETIDRSDE